jgi:lipopolysaccharide transport system ATP-binding protein
VDDRSPIVVVDRVAKRYGTDLSAIRRYGTRSIRDELFGRQPSGRPLLRNHEFWALQDVSFELQPGEALGIVGDNGAGKTTLLRLLHGLTRPDWGTISVNGRTAALIELGSAFDEYATGREAIAMEGVVLGLSPDQLRDLEVEIIDFAELADVIDAPVRTYSLGMRMRLGYAIAAHVRPELLLVDEVLGVGDAAFQRKCVGYIRRHLDEGGSLVLVSHDMWQIRAVCSRCLVLHAGRIVASGDVQQALHAYMEQSLPPATNHSKADADAAKSDGPVRIEWAELVGGDGRAVTAGDDAVLMLTIANDGPTLRVRCAVAIGPMEVPVSAIGAATDQAAPLTVPSGRSRASCAFGMIALTGGTYAVRAALVAADGGEILATIGWSDAPLTVKVLETPGEDQTPFRMIGSLAVLRPSWPDQAPT